MPLQLRGLYPTEEPAGLAILPETFASRRFFKWAGGSGTVSLAVPASGALCDGVSGPAGSDGRVSAVVLRHPGALARVESGAAFAADAELQCDSQGRAITLAGGVRLARSLAAAGAAGEAVWVSLA